MHDIISKLLIVAVLMISIDVKAADPEAVQKAARAAWGGTEAEWAAHDERMERQRNEGRYMIYGPAIYNAPLNERIVDQEKIEAILIGASISDHCDVPGERITERAHTRAYLATARKVIAIEVSQVKNTLGEVDENQRMIDVFFSGSFSEKGFGWVTTICPRP